MLLVAEPAWGTGGEQRVRVEEGRPAGTGDLVWSWEVSGTCQRWTGGHFVSSLPGERPKGHISTLQGRCAVEYGWSRVGVRAEAGVQAEAPLTG